MDDTSYGDTIHIRSKDPVAGESVKITVTTHTWDGPEALALLGLAGGDWLWDVAVDEGWATREEIAAAVADVLRPEEPHNGLVTE